MSKRAKAPKSPARRGDAARPARRAGAPKRAKPRTSSASLERKLEQRTREFNEALERQAATAEILRVISSSPGELEPVFQTILENARQICRANYATVFLFENELYMQKPHSFIIGRFSLGVAQVSVDCKL